MRSSDRLRYSELIGALAETVPTRALTPLEHIAIDSALTPTAVENEMPILPRIVDPILTPRHDPDWYLIEDGLLVGHTLRRLAAGNLADLFDGSSTVGFDPDLTIISLDLPRVPENSILISMLMTCSSQWVASALLAPKRGQR